MKLSGLTLMRLLVRNQRPSLKNKKMVKASERKLMMLRDLNRLVDQGRTLIKLLTTF
jgi:hypothetical protein